MKKSAEFYLDEYVSLASDVHLKLLESPSLYKASIDSLYEVNDKVFDFLLKCDGTTKLTYLKPEKGFLNYCLEESLLEFYDKPQKRTIKVGKSATPSLRYLLVNSTLRCNLSCKHCYLGDSLKIDLSLSDVKNVCVEFEDIGGLRLIVSGGEPLLHPDFYKINDLMERRAFRSILITNGTLLDDEICLKLKFDEVQVSLDGMKKGHDFLRGKGCFRKTIAGIKALKKAKIDLSVATMAYEGNKEEFDELEKLVRDFEAVSWTIDVPTEAGRLLDYPQLVFNLKELTELTHRQYGAEVHEAYGDFICGAHLGCVQADGTFTKCGFYQGEWKGGNIKEGLKKCWENLPKMKVSELDCECDFINECRGGCRYRAEVYNKNRYSSDPVKCFYFGVKI